MATVNAFDLLADDDNDDPSHLIAVRQQKVASKKPCAPAAVPATKFLNKPLPPAQAGNGDVNGFAGGYGGGVSEEGDGDKPYERGRGGYGAQRQSFRGGRLVGYGNSNGEGGSDSERPPRRRRWKRSGL